MLELLKDCILALKEYGATDQDIFFILYNFIGLVPLNLYVVKINNYQYNFFKIILIQIIRIALFLVGFYMYIRYGFTNVFIRCSSLLLIIYTLVGYYYWTQKNIFLKLKYLARKILVYSFFMLVLVNIFFAIQHLQL